MKARKDNQKGMLERIARKESQKELQGRMDQKGECMVRKARPEREDQNSIDKLSADKPS